MYSNHFIWEYLRSQLQRKTSAKPEVCLLVRMLIIYLVGSIFTVDIDMITAQ